MKEVNHKQLKEILKIAYKTNRAYFVWGSTGVGKSYTIKKLAEELAEEENREFVEWNGLSRDEKLKIVENLDKYFLFIDQRALQFDLGDFKLPKFDNNNGTFEWTIPLVYQVVCDKRCKGVLFFDEFNLSPPSIQGMFYQIINDRQIGEHKINDGVFIVGAGNRIEDRANVYEMASPLLDRFEHLTLAIPSIEEWTNWATENDIDSKIIAFLHFKPSYLFKFDTKSKDKSFPTPRGWHYLSEQLKFVKEKDYDTLEHLVSANVGEACAVEMLAFLKLREKIDIRDLLKNPNKVKEIDRTDLKYAIVSELPNIYKNNKEELKNITNIIKNLEPEFAILSLKLLKGVNKTHFVKNIVKFKEITKYFNYLL